MHAAFKEFGRRHSTYFKMAITAPIAPLQTPVQKAHLKAIVNRCQKILFLFICCFAVFICFLYSFIFGVRLHVPQSFLLMQANVANSVAIELIILCRGLIAAFLL